MLLSCIYFANFKNIRPSDTLKLKVYVDLNIKYLITKKVHKLCIVCATFLIVISKYSAESNFLFMIWLLRKHVKIFSRQL